MKSYEEDSYNKFIKELSKREHIQWVGDGDPRYNSGGMEHQGKGWYIYIYI